MSGCIGKRFLSHTFVSLDQVAWSTHLIKDKIYHLFILLLTGLWLAIVRLFQGYCLYDPTCRQMTKHHDVIFDEHFPHGPPRSLPSLLNSNDSSDGSPHVSMKHVSSTLIGSLVDDSQLVVVDLSTSPSNVGPPYVLL